MPIKLRAPTSRACAPGSLALCAARSRYENSGGTESPRAFVFADYALLSDDASYTAGNVVVVVANSSADFRALMASEPLTAAGHEFDVRDAYRWRVSQDPFLLRNAWPEELERGGHQPGPYLHLSFDRAAGEGGGEGGAEDPAALRRRTRALHLSFLRKTERTMCGAAARARALASGRRRG